MYVIYFIYKFYCAFLYIFKYNFEYYYFKKNYLDTKSLYL